jgi:hypothetical protein
LFYLKNFHPSSFGLQLDLHPDSAEASDIAGDDAVALRLARGALYPPPPARCRARRGSTTPVPEKADKPRARQTAVHLRAQLRSMMKRPTGCVPATQGGVMDRAADPAGDRGIWGPRLLPRIFRRLAGQPVCRVNGAEKAGLFLTLLRNHPALLDASTLSDTREVERPVFASPERSLRITADCLRQAAVTDGHYVPSPDRIFVPSSRMPRLVTRLEWYSRTVVQYSTNDRLSFLRPQQRVWPSSHKRTVRALVATLGLAADCPTSWFTGRASSIAIYAHSKCDAAPRSLRARSHAASMKTLAMSLVRWAELRRSSNRATTASASRCCSPTSSASCGSVAFGYAARAAHKTSSRLQRSLRTCAG